MNKQDNFRSDSTKYIFLPAGGWWYDTNYGAAGTQGNYWSSTLVTSNTSYGYTLYSRLAKAAIGNLDRNYGFSIHPIR